MPSSTKRSDAIEALESIEHIEVLAPIERLSGANAPLPFAGTVSVVVTARNQAAYLQSCLHSVLAQTIPPQEILYFDDGSTDESVRIVEEFRYAGVRVEARPHRGVVAARNEAAALTSGDYLLFVDGDNMLAPDYLERMLEVVDADHGFAYPCKQDFGLSTSSWVPPEYDRDRLWNENFVDSCALIRREVFEAVGGWQETPLNTMWDWNLFLRAGRHTRGVRSKAVLYYRQHPENWSRRVDGEHTHRWGEFKGMLRRSATNVVVCCAYSGRVAGALQNWFDAVRASLSAVFQPSQCELFVIDDSPEGFWTNPAAEPTALTESFRSVRVERVYRGLPAAQRRQDRTATARWLTSIYNRFLQEATAEILWFIEDDIIVPPNAATDLSELLLIGDRPQAAVTGYYRSRHEDAFVVSDERGGRVEHETSLPRSPRPYDLTGTGCLMLFRPRNRVTFGSAWVVPHRNFIVHAHDWVFSWRLKEAGTPVLAHPGVVCRHLLSESESV